MKLTTFLLPLFVAGILSAQPAAPYHRQMMMQKLGLTADQQAQARSIFQSARQETQAMAPQLRQEHQAMAAAIKSDNEAQIDQLSQQNAQMNAQAHAIRAKAMAKFYSILTPDQKAKFDQRMTARGPRTGQHNANRQS